MAAILVAIPVFNELKYVEKIIAQVRKYTEQILIIDDGSADGTSNVLKSQNDIEIISHDKNMGYGQTLIDAFEFARREKYDWIITIDCDLQHEPSHLPHFFEEIEKDDCDIISGSRYLKPVNKSVLNISSDRLIINKKITKIFNTYLNVELTDSFCGFKAYRIKPVSQLRLTEAGYGFPLQLIIRAFQSGLRIREISVPLIYLDPKRCFGGKLDNPTVRMKHYIGIIEQELGHSVSKNLTEHFHSNRKGYNFCTS